MLRNTKKLTLLTVVIYLATSDGQTFAGDGFGKIEGRVSLSPIRPICRVEDPCNGAYAQAKVAARSESGDIVASATTDKQGTFSLKVPAGNLVVSVEVGGRFPRCPNARVVVTAAATVRADIDCDTGMR